MKDKILKCLLLEDDPDCVELLRKYLAHIGNLEIVGEFDNTREARHFLKSKPDAVDFLLVDIQLSPLDPTNRDGMVFVETYAGQPGFPPVIITSDHVEYLAEGLENDIIDFLPKPLPFARLERAVERVRARLAYERGGALSPKNIFVRVTETKHGEPITFFKRLYFSEIQYFEQDGNYAKAFSQDPNKALAIFEQSMVRLKSSLPPQFRQVERGLVVNTDFIDIYRKNQIEGFVIMKNGAKLSVGGNYYRALDYLINA